MKNIISICFFLFIGMGVKAQSGLYLRLEYYGNNLDIQWLYFTDSVVVRNPKFGVSPLQLEKELAENRQNVGKISARSNTKMALKWGNGISQVVNIEIKNNDLSIFDRVACSKAIPFQESTIDNKAFSGLGNFNNLSKDISLFLGKDGKFIYEKKMGTGDIQKEEGIYTITGNIIQFNYNNGKEWRAFVHTYDLVKQDIIIDQQIFKGTK